LALWLARKGVPLRIIDKNAGPGLYSRAMVVQARTLELYRQLGIAEEVIASGIKAEEIHLRDGTRETAVLKFGDIGGDLSPYPFALSFPQDDHERLLTQVLAREGIQVKWNTELTAFEQLGDKVEVQINGAGKTDFSYVCGCDGASSTVRHLLGLHFPGGTYENVFFVADVEAPKETVSENGFAMCLSSAGFILVFPIRSSGNFRLIGLLPEELRQRTDLSFDDVRGFVEDRVGVQTGRVHWFSTYRIHHRVAERFRDGRVFLAGDAGHIHSPAGGQGMNTGIGDAVNLAWKLADVANGRRETLLDTYEPERIAFARALVASTDRAFGLLAGPDLGSHLLREALPHLAPVLLGFSGVRRAAFKVVSQVRIQYRESELSVGHAGELEAGDRLPWVKSVDNFEPLKSLDWQLHFYGAASGILEEAKALGIPCHVFPWTTEAEDAGFAKDAAYLVRPDGYIAWVNPSADGQQLRQYWRAKIEL
jgi:2-polyprenyl-6-methoxyphenol hydroxylase-like FAD-dependent oxidoreductase